MNPGPREVAGLLVALGCPTDRVELMASQLLKRATQLATERSWSESDALAHLLRMMAGGWAAQARGLDASAFPSPASASPPMPPASRP